MMFRTVFRRSLHYKIYPSIVDLQSKDTFLHSTQNNKLYQTLITKLNRNEIEFTPDLTKVSPELNSLVTLPATISPIVAEKDKIKNDAKSIPGWRKTPTLWYRIIRRQMKVYRLGINGIYKLHKQYKTIPADLYSSSRLLQNLEVGQIDKEITRKGFVEMLRKQEFWKLPRFLLMFFVFEELFLVMVYFWPKLGLRSCLTVGSFKKISDQHIFQESIRRQLSGTISEGTNTRLISSPYDLDIKILKQILKNLPVNDVPSWKTFMWVQFNIKGKLAEAVAQKYQYYVVDDWLLLSNFMINNRESVISYNELVNMVLERQLYNKGEDLNKMVNDDLGRKVLIWRMVLYWSFRFEDVDILSLQQQKGFISRWGVNNVSILNFPGTLSEFGDKVELFDKKHLKYIQ